MGVILFMGVSQAVKMLKLDIVSSFFQEATDFAGPVLIGLAILVVGLWLANMARRTILNGPMANAGTALADSSCMAFILVFRIVFRIVFCCCRIHIK